MLDVSSPGWIGTFGEIWLPIRKHMILAGYHHQFGAQLIPNLCRQSYHNLPQKAGQARNQIFKTTSQEHAAGTFDIQVQRSYCLRWELEAPNKDARSVHDHQEHPSSRWLELLEDLVTSNIHNSVVI
jgi:hypothetical protein